MTSREDSIGTMIETSKAAQVAGKKRKVITIKECLPLLLLLVPVVAFMLPAESRTNFIGIVASTIAFVMFVPQAVRVWRARNDPHALVGISLSTQFLVLGNATIWGVYAVLLSEFWVGAPGIINAPLALTVIVLVVRSRVKADPSNIEIEEIL